MPNRISIKIDESLETRLESVKKENFYNKSFSDMYRYLINLGLDQLEKKGTKKCQKRNS